MKTALISFRDTEQNYERTAEESLVWAFNAGGIRVDDISVLSVKDDLGFKRRLDELEKAAFTNVIVLCSDEVTFDIKGFLAKKLGVSLEENKNARKFIQEYNDRTGNAGGSEYALLPRAVRSFPTSTASFRGFWRKAITPSPCCQTAPRRSAPCAAPIFCLTLKRNTKYATINSRSNFSA